LEFTACAHQRSWAEDRLVTQRLPDRPATAPNVRPRNDVENITWTFVEFFLTLAWLRTGGSPEESGGFPDRPRRPWVRPTGQRSAQRPQPLPCGEDRNGRFVGRWTWQPTPETGPGTRHPPTLPSRKRKPRFVSGLARLGPPPCRCRLERRGSWSMTRRAF
jgi:hypothetical protein